MVLLVLGPLWLVLVLLVLLPLVPLLRALLELALERGVLLLELPVQESLLLVLVLEPLAELRPRLHL